MAWHPPKNNIKTVSFKVLGSDDNKTKSYVKVSNGEQLTEVSTINNKEEVYSVKPVPKGVYDAFMGTIDYQYLCETCGGKKSNCLGHFGSIDLKDARVLSPLFIKNIIKWLKVICPKCYKLAYSEEEIKKMSPITRLDKLAKLTSTKDKDVSGNKTLKNCVHCNAERYSVKRLDDDKSSIGWVIGKQLIRIRTREADEILNRISDSDFKLMGQINHPRVYVLNTLPVSPVHTRPETRQAKDDKTKLNDQTISIKAMLEDLEKGPDMISGLPDDIRLNQHYYEMIYGPVTKTTNKTNKNRIKAIRELIPGKEGGIIRSNLLGKRTQKTARLVICGDSSLNLTQVGLPMSVAMKIYIPETVTASNIDRVKTYFENGKYNYPGCAEIMKNGILYQISNNNTLTVDVGDIIYRHMIDGDDVMINRAPSLLPSSETAMKVVVHNDNTMKFNVMNCALFNADFDGDAMTAYILQSEGARIEASIVSGVSQFMISHKNSTPFIGQVQDSVLGLAMLSNNKTNYNKLNAMRMIGLTSLNPKFTNKSYTGYDILTMSLDGIDINFERKPTIFKENSHLPYINKYFTNKDKKVIIKNGVYESGILDKSSIAGGASSGLYHVIYKQHGPEKTLNLMFNMQQLAIGHLQIEGMTVGYSDLLKDEGLSVKTPAGVMPKSEITISDRIAEKTELFRLENDILINNLQKRNIYPPLGKTIEEHIEDIQTNNLRIMDVTDIIMSSINPLTNNFYKMISYGSKGKFPNLQLMGYIVGLILVNEKMPERSFGYKRSLPYYQMCDLSIESRGFVEHSYINGINLTGLFYMSMAERHSIIMKALFTSVIGSENRTAIKNLEGVIINNLRQVVNGKILINPTYGGDGVDIRKSIQVSIPTLLLSNTELKSVYSELGDEYLKIILNDRDEIRKSFKSLYDYGDISIFNDMVSSPVDIPRIIESIYKIDKNDKNDKNDKIDKIDKIDKNDKDNKNIKNKIEKILNFTNDQLNYITMNTNAYELSIPVPEYLEKSLSMTKYLIRAYFTPEILKNITEEQLDEIFLKILYSYSESLIDYGTAVGIIAAQCASEPLTQYVLHSIHHAVSGGTKKGGVIKLKEIISPKESNKLDAIMHIYLNPGIDIIKAKLISTNIQLLKLYNFLISSQICVESEYGQIHDEELKSDKEMMSDFAKYFPLMTPPSNLVKWFIRLVVNKEELLLKGVSVVNIVDVLRKKYKNSHIVYSNENNNDVIVRLYWSINQFKIYPNSNDIEALLYELIDTIIRGVDIISNTTVKEVNKMDFGTDGEIIKNKKEPVIITNGSNMYELLISEYGQYIDPLRISTDSVVETMDMFGIEEARMLIIMELQKIVTETNPRHLMVYADEMCVSGIVTSIERKGLKTRQQNNILLRIAHQSPILSLIYGAEYGITSPVNTVSEALILGRVPKLGTHYNSVCVNEDFVKANFVSEDAQIAEMSDL
jgi:DNA-directed RNA polymerase II subunit RPB1